MPENFSDIRNLEDARGYIAKKGGAEAAAQALIDTTIQNKEEHSHATFLLGGASLALSALHQFLAPFEEASKENKNDADAKFGQILIKKFDENIKTILGGDKGVDPDRDEMVLNFKKKIADATGADFKIADDFQQQHINSNDGVHKKPGAADFI
jgi:hypothetical protein